MSGDPVIEARGVRTVFGDHVVHDGVDLIVEQGEIMGLVGGSGSGKSVLMNEILNLMRPSGGSVHVFGKDVHKLNERQRREMARRIGVLFQRGALFSQLTVLENVKVPMREQTDLSEALMDELALLKLAMVGLGSEAASKMPSELSGGMVKRASLARALALDPDLIFLDEPTAGLDPIGASAFDALINDLSDTLNLTVLMVTHDLDSLFAVCDRVAVLADKRIVAVETPQQLVHNSHPWIQEYFNGPRGRAALA